MGRQIRLLKQVMAASTTAIALASSTVTLHGAEPMKPDLGDLVVIEPEKDGIGRPVVRVGADHKVDIAPAMHIHRLYYSGDREFQGPIMSGGPTTVVAKHPKTGQQVHIEVVLPPGTPVISYDNNSITYIFPDHRVRVGFCTHSRNCDKCKGPYTVSHVDGPSLERKLRDQQRETSADVKTVAKSSKLLHAAHDQFDQRVNVVKGAIGVADQTGATVIDKVGQIFSMVPFVAPLESLGKQSSARANVEQMRRAGIKQEKEATEYFKTLR